MNQRFILSDNYRSWNDGVVSAMDVGNLILQKAEFYALRNGIRKPYMTRERLQIYVFFVQGKSFEKTGSKLFEDELYASEDGIRIPEFEFFGNKPGSGLDHHDVRRDRKRSSGRFTLKQQDLVWDVMEECTKKDLKTLQTEIKGMDLWKNAINEKDKRISRADIKNYFDKRTEYTEGSASFEDGVLSLF